MQIKVGCCGFPVGRKEYAAKLALVEVQQTFYQPPRWATARRWRGEVPPGFDFTLKAWQLITHEPTSPTYRRLKEPLTPEERGQAGAFRPTPLVKRAWEVTREIAVALAARVILFQCPPRFGPTPENLANLRRFFGELDRGDFTLAWEARGKWPREEFLALCRELHLLPALDPFATLPGPGPRVYFRLHGRNGYRYAYTATDLQELAAFLKDRQEAYVLFNNLSMWPDACRFSDFIAKRAF
ncbi:MAG: DUF72 domain-containing protein [Thermodesulfobacteriota bacterium]